MNPLTHRAGDATLEVVSVGEMLAEPGIRNNTRLAVDPAANHWFLAVTSHELPAAPTEREGATPC
ncbi:hypothetical protein [Nocardia neocaledoniensis]|uniref:hypothetical protein n=1 Tax=Nocardia neocaledoniensis TaxID=236511 RepID=UPI002456A36B|nr:hypothetical protein [Nocardia neocaledoniensis]